MTWPRGTRSPQPLHLRSKGGLGLVSISYGTAIMRRFQLDWNGSFEIGSAATEGGFLPVLISYVYVASQRFVDTVSLEKLAQEVGWAIATYGSTTAGSSESLEELLSL